MSHPTGEPLGSGTCGSCAWFQERRACLALQDESGPRTVEPTWPGCHRFERPVDCEPCGACCREAFDAVPVEPTDTAFQQAHPELLLTESDGWMHIRRVPTATGSRCANLVGDGTAEPFRCRHYATRPTACRELMQNSENCLLARRRVGLSL